ncbi:probable glutamate receptor [Argiope bruennichi]|uniref:probable glutamate receptor n=1 Tax=Argiope bruennichi TaxID=94029 RepID=UPI00249479C1|nr:probable glutamate receptor [Argiope bruennichi]
MDCPSFLRVSIVPMKDMIVCRRSDGNVELLGIQGRFLNTVLKAMHMPFQLVIAEDGEWGRLLPSGNWTGMIGKIQKGNADIADSHIGITEQRTAVVDFSTVYLIDDMTFAIKKPGPVPTSLAFVRPFDFITWILIFTILLVVPLIFQWTFHCKRTYIYFFLSLLGSIFRQPTFTNFKIKKFKPVLFSWCFFATIVSFSYSAVLLSMLSVPSEIIAVQNFKELADAVKNDGYRSYVKKGSATLDFMLRNDKEYLKYLGESAVHHNWYTNSLPLTLTDQINHRSALIDPRTKLQMVAGPEEWKPHFLSDDSLQTYQFAVAMKKNFCHKKKLNTVISRINNAGLYMQFTNEERYKLWLSASERRRNDSKKIKPLTLEDLSGVFGAFLVGLVLNQINHRSALIDPRTKLQMVAGPEEWKPHFLSGDSLQTYQFAVAMKKNFCHKKKLNTVISRINNAGLYMQFTNEER